MSSKEQGLKLAQAADATYALWEQLEQITEYRQQLDDMQNQLHDIQVELMRLAILNQDKRKHSAR